MNISTLVSMIEADPTIDEVVAKTSELVAAKQPEDTKDLNVKVQGVFDQVLALIDDGTIKSPQDALAYTAKFFSVLK